MDGVSWSTSREPESFKRTRTTADTLNRLASFIARAESKQSTRSNPEQTPPFPCQECGESFPYATELIKHQEVQHTLPKPHRCPSCGKEFSLRSSLQLHKCEDSSPLFQGETCNGPSYATCLSNVSDADRPTDSPSHCQPHMLDSSPYACAPCGKGFNHKQALLHHQQALCSKTLSPCIDNPSSPPLDSPSVSEEESSSNSLDILGPSATTDNVCIFCSRTFRNEASFQRHKQINHSDEMQTDPCSPFDKRESTREGSKGSNAKSQKKVFSCRSCEMVFRSTSKLYIHRKEKHSRGIKIRTEPGPVNTKHRRASTYTCQICSKVFFHHLSLWAHTRKHPASTFSAIKDKSWTTKETTKDFKSIEKPNTVKKSVPNKMSVWDSPCPRTVSTEKNQRKLLRYEEVPDVEEEEEVEFPCPSCPEVFSLHSELKNHIELHQTAVRRSRCSVCTHEMDSCKWPCSKKHRLYHCVPCQQGFSSLDSFLTHCQDHLRVKVEEEGLTEGSTRPAS